MQVYTISADHTPCRFTRAVPSLLQVYTNGAGITPGLHAVPKHSPDVIQAARTTPLVNTRRAKHTRGLYMQYYADPRSIQAVQITS